MMTIPEGAKPIVSVEKHDNYVVVYFDGNVPARLDPGATLTITYTYDPAIFPGVHILNARTDSPGGPESSHTRGDGRLTAVPPCESLHQGMALNWICPDCKHSVGIHMSDKVCAACEAIFTTRGDGREA